MMESFFGILKSEMFYGYEKTFKSIEHLEQAIVDYINYYNNKRIKVKQNILRLVVRKSPTGESTHYFFVMLK